MTRAHAPYADLYCSFFWMNTAYLLVVSPPAHTPPLLFSFFHSQLALTGFDSRTFPKTHSGHVTKPAPDCGRSACCKACTGGRVISSRAFLSTFGSITVRGCWLILPNSSSDQCCSSKTDLFSELTPSCFYSNNSFSFTSNTPTHIIRDAWSKKERCCYLTKIYNHYSGEVFL